MKGGRGLPLFLSLKRFSLLFMSSSFPAPTLSFLWFVSAFHSHSHLLHRPCHMPSLLFSLVPSFTRPCVSLAPPSLPPALCQVLPVHVTITVQPICSVSQPLVRLSDLLCLDTPTRQRRIPAIHISQVTLSPFCINTVAAKTLPVHGKSLYCDCCRQENMICAPRQISDSRELLI